MNTKTFNSFIFTHIPKCGGTSFRKFIYDSALQSNLAEEQLYIPGFGSIGNDENLPQLNPEQLEHLKNRKVQVLADHTPFNGHIHYNLKMDRPFFYTILRDPIKRFISHYNFFYFHLGYDDCKGVSLEELASDKLDVLLDSLSNVQVKFLSGFDDLGQKERIPEERLYYIAKYNLNYRFNAIGILEDMNNSFQCLGHLLPEWLKFDVTQEMQKKNVNSHAPKNTISDEVEQKIIRANQYDLNLYAVAKLMLADRLATINQAT